jgi:hypothetical protein
MQPSSSGANISVASDQLVPYGAQPPVMLHQPQHPEHSPQGAHAVERQQAAQKMAVQQQETSPAHQVACGQHTTAAHGTRLAGQQLSGPSAGVVMNAHPVGVRGETEGPNLVPSSPYLPLPLAPATVPAVVQGSQVAEGGEAVASRVSLVANALGMASSSMTSRPTRLAVPRAACAAGAVRAVARREGLPSQRDHTTARMPLACYSPSPARGWR